MGRKINPQLLKEMIICIGGGILGTVLVVMAFVVFLHYATMPQEQSTIAPTTTSNNAPLYDAVGAIKKRTP